MTISWETKPCFDGVLRERGSRTKPLPEGGYQVQKGEKHEANYHILAVCQRNATL